MDAKEKPPVEVSQQSDTAGLVLGIIIGTWISIFLTAVTQPKKEV